MLSLLTTATGATESPASMLGRPIEEWDPHDLEVHPASAVPEPDPERSGLIGMNRPDRVPSLPSYVRRPHDEELAAVIAATANGYSRMVVLVGSSSTGKTRACWEAVQPLVVEGWRLWHPFDPTRAEAVLADLERVAPRTVVWLNEAQHYLGASQGVGERIAAALRTLLLDSSRQPVLILSTLWPEYATVYTTLPQQGQEDPHAQVRELLAGRRITLPDAFDANATEATKRLAAAGDRQLANALAHARDGRLTQYLAGAPELLHRYETAAPPVRALLQAAMDARRLGVGLHLPLIFLEQAAADYLTEDEYSTLSDNWLEQALADASTPVHGNLAPLRRVRRRPAHSAGTAAPGHPIYRLTDYLEQNARQQRRLLCPPESFWQAAYDHLTHFEDLAKLAEAAMDRYRMCWAHHLWGKAVRKGAPMRAGRWRENRLLAQLVELRETVGDHEGAEQLVRQFANAGDPAALQQLARMHETAGDHERAEQIACQAADGGDLSALHELIWIRETTGNNEGAERLLQKVAKDGSSHALRSHFQMRQPADDYEGTEQLVYQIAETSDSTDAQQFARMQNTTENCAGVENLLLRDAGTRYALTHVELALFREKAGDHEGAEQIARQAADAGNVDVLIRLAWRRVENGDREKAECLLQQAVTAGSTYALRPLAQLREAAGDRAGAENLLRSAIDTGSTYTLAHLAELRERAGDHEGAERVTREEVSAGSTYALRQLSQMREAAGDHIAAERLARQAAYAGGTIALTKLAELRERAGDQKGANRLALQAADAGNSSALRLLAEIRREAGVSKHGLWLYGLEPDGRPSAPWDVSPSVDSP
ncbi:tetratricopeptide repeat protein [Streptomyces hirsutus]|uniref:tetratricopeptide repeat protein n=1 Tax=Streptomyces hirsutus TaxID=35620 RepID=UPI00332C4066